MTVRLLSIENVQLTLSKSNPPTLVVIANGRAATPGYTNIRLGILEGELSPDGIFDLEFVGEPPGGIVPQVVVPAHANLIIERDVERIVGVMVHARTNSITALVGASGPADAGAGIGQAFTGGAKTLAIGEEGFSTLALGEEGPHTFAGPFSEGSGPFAMETDARSFFEKDPRVAFEKDPRLVFEKDFRSEILRKPAGDEGFDPREGLIHRGPFGGR
jgi:hypothetical protein